MDLLSPEYRKLVKPGDSPFKGHCYIASEAFYHLWGRDNGYYPHHIRVREVSHWFLRNRTGHVIDLTKEQFPFEVDYPSGRPCGFLTKVPSKRCSELIRRIKKHG